MEPADSSLGNESGAPDSQTTASVLAPTRARADMPAPTPARVGVDLLAAEPIAVRPVPVVADPEPAPMPVPLAPMEEPLETAPLEATKEEPAPEPVVGEDLASPGKKGMARLSLLRFNRLAFLTTGGVLAGVVLVVVAALLFSHFVIGKHPKTNLQGVDNYAVGKLSLNGLQSEEQLQLGTASQLSVNGLLRVNNSLILAPANAPNSPSTGQIYFDQAAKAPLYYNGTQFVSLAPQQHVASIGGVAGDITLGQGLSLAGNQLSLSGDILQQVNAATATATAAAAGTRVTSLQGQTGDVTLNGGPGISINGTTISSSGVISLVSGSGNLSVTNDGAGNYTVAYAGTVVSSITGTANQINVSASTGNVVLSLPQDIAVTSAPTFGSLTVSGTLAVQGANSISLGTAVGHTGSVKLYNSTNGNSLTLQSGATAGNLTLTLPTADGTNGACLMTNGLGTLSFQTCTGGPGGGVTSIDGLTGIVTLNNSSPGGSAITIDNAAANGATKGIATFNATNFTDNGAGIINTVQGIASTSSPTFAGLTINGTATATTLNATSVIQLNGANINTAGTLSNVAYLNGTGPQTFIGNNKFTGTVLTQLNSATAFEIQDGSGTSNLFVADTGTNRIGIGTLGPGYRLDVQGGDINTSGIYRVNGAQISSANLSNDSNLAKLNSSNIFSAANTFSSTVAIQGSNSLTLGSASNVGSIIFRDGVSANTGTLQLGGTLAGSVTFNLPVATGSQTICTYETGNCAGSGSSITGSGTINKLAKFTGTQAIGSSSISDDGTVVTVSTGQIIQGAAGLTLGASGVNGQLVFTNSTNSNTLTLQSGVTTGNLTLTLPTGDGSNGNCLKTNGSGVLSFASCTGGPGGGVTSVNALSGVLNIVGTTNQVNVSSAGDTITLSLPQDINTGGNATFRTVTLTGQTAGDNLIVANAVSGATGKLLDLKVNNVSKFTVDPSGNVNTVGQYQVNGAQISSANLSNDSNLAKLNGTGPQIFTGNNEFTGTVLTQLNSPTAFQIQNSTGTSNLLVADTTTTRIGIGTATPGYTLDVNGDINTNGVYRINGNTVCSASGCTAAAGSGNYIQNGTSPQTADFNITGTGTIGGTLYFGAAQDTNLYRNAANELKTDDDFSVGGSLGVTSTATFHSAVDIQGNLQHSSNSDFAIYTSTSGKNIDLQSNGGLIKVGRYSDDATLFSVSNSTGQVAITTTGSGGGLVIGGDTNLYRGGTNLLQTDDYLQVAGMIWGQQNVITQQGNAAQVSVGNYGPGAVAGIAFGSASDTNLYRLSAGVLKTDGALTVAGLLTGTTGTTLSGGTINLNASSNNATNINTGTSTGAVTIGNTTAAATTTIKSGTAGIVLTGAGGSSNVGVLVKPNSDTTAAFKIQNADASNTLFNADTTNSLLTVTELRPATIALQLVLPGGAIDSTGNVGQYNSVQMGLDGFPRISYYDVTNTNLKFVQCTNASCSTNNITTVDTGAGLYTSLAIGGDGFARISYTDGTNLKFVQCTNASCSTHNITTVDSSSSAAYTSIAMGLDGFARISYRATGSALKFVQCTNASCSTSVITSITGGNDGFTSVAIGADGFARISYGASASLRFAQCTNAACSTNTLTSISTGGDGTQHTSITMASDGFARISYYDADVGTLGFVQCTNAACSTQNKNTVDSSGAVGRYNSLAIASDGFARISYYDSTNGDLKFAQCTNTACSTSTITRLDATGNTGQYTSLALGSDGYARVSYYDSTNANLNLIRTAINGTVGTAIGASSAAFGQLNAASIALGNYFSVDATGQVLVRPSVDSASAFQVQNAAGTALLLADTSGSNLTVNQGTLNLTGLTIPSSLSVNAGANSGGSLSGATTYYYRVTAVTAGGESVPAGEQIMSASSFTPVSAPVSAPSASATSTGVVSCDNSAGCTYEATFFTANGETTAGSASSAVLNISGQSVNLTSIPVGATGTTGRNIYIKSLTMFGDTNYHLEATINDNTTTSMTDDGSGSTASCYNCQAPPGSNTARTNVNNASLSWTAVSGATSYKVYRGTTPGQENTLAGSPGTNSFTDTGGGSGGTPSPSGGVKFGNDAEIYRSAANTLTANASLILQASSNSATALQVLNTSSQNILQVDTSGNAITLGTVNTVGTSGYGGSPGTPPVPGISSSWGSGGGTTGSWSSTGSLPDYLSDASTVVTGGYIYEIGGYSDAYGGVSYEVYSAPIDGTGIGSWTDIGQLPDSLRGTSVVATGGYIYVMGGSDCSGSDSCSVTSVYSAQTTPDGALDNGWNTISTMPIDVYDATAVTDGDYIYVMGGYSANTLGTNSDYVMSAQITPDGALDNGWSYYQTLPNTLYGANSVIYNGYVYLLGGSSLDDNPGGATSSTYSAPINGDGSLGSWTLKASGNSRWAAASVSYGGYIYQLTGYNGGTLAGTTNESVQYTGGDSLSSWNFSVSQPAQMQQANTVAYAGYVYLLGGNTSGSPNGNPTNTIYRATINGTPDVIGQTAVPATPGTPGYAGTSSTAGNAVNLRVNGNGTIHTNTNSTTAFQVQNAAGTSVFAVDTTNNLFTLNGVQFQASSSSDNIVLGSASTSLNGAYNAGLGYGALQGNSGYYNVGVGYAAMTSGNSGYYNTAIGFAALHNNTSGGSNTAIGALSLTNNTGGSYNIALGGALYNNTNGGQNVGLGLNALYTNTSGSNGIAMGSYALYNNNSGNNNIGIGTSALVNTTTGSGNVGIGTSALSGNGTGSNNTAIGNGAGITSSNLSNATAIGYNASVSASNMLVLGAGADVCIGYTSCTHKLAVNGAAYATSFTSSGSPDISEYIPTANDVQAADVVSANPDGSVGAMQSQTAYDATAIGVISDGTSSFIGNASADNGEETGRQPLVLAGRVPVHVTDEGGAIEPGDYLTTSSTPGYAMKATHAGPTIGKALAAFDGTSGAVMTLVNLSYYNGPSPADYIQSGGSAILSNLTVGGTADFADLNASGNTTLNNLAVTGSASIDNLTVSNLSATTADISTLTVTGSAQFSGDITVGGHIITAGGQPTTQTQAAVGAGASVTVQGTDTTGTITITTGAAPTAGDLAKIVFSKIYGQAPHVVLSPSNPNAAGLRFYKGATGASDFMFDALDNPAPNTTYTYDYLIAQ